MDSSAANSPAEGANSINIKRKRVSRACDACFNKKDRCDGVRPVCKVCKSIGRPCTYNRPERKRGPSQGVRQRLEGQVESLEGILGYLVDTYPQVCTDVIRNLRLEDVEGAMLNSLPPNNSMNTPSPSSSHVITNINVYPQFSRQDARDRWRISSFAKAVAPSLGLSLAGEDEDEDIYGMDSVRHRIEEARMARAKIIGGIADNSPTMSSNSQHFHHRPTPAHYSAPAPSVVNSNFQVNYPHQPAPHYPHYPQHHSAKDRSNLTSIPSAASHHTSFPPEQTSTHHTFAYHTQPTYSRPPDNFPSTASIVPPAEPYGSYPTTSLEGETDALAYALGLTYSSSPQNNQITNRQHIGPSAHPISWMGPPSSISDSPGDIMRSIDQHMQSTAADDVEEPHSATFDFFADHDLQPNHQQLSVLHQLGLQGSIDMPTPIDTSDRGNNNHNPSSSAYDEVASSSSSSSNNNHHNSTHWLQPIRGLN